MALEPDQPVQPRVPTLVPRASQQTAAPQQQPQPPFQLTPQEQAQVDRVLSQWEERNRNIKTFDCQFKRWVYDVVFGPADRPKFIDTGVIKFAAPDRGMIRADMTEKNGATVPIEDGSGEVIANVSCQINFQHQSVVYASASAGPPLTDKSIEFLRSRGLCKD